MKVDLLIKNGRVIDPSTGTNGIKDIAVVGKKLADIETAPEVEAKQEIDASGLLVVPGLVDAHCHLNYLGSAGGLPADAALLPMGVTAAADAGSTGVSNCRMLFHQLGFQKLKTRVYLNVSAGGQIMSSHFPESMDYSKWDDELFSAAIEDGGGKVVGFKIRTSRKVVGDRGMKPMEAALSLARRFHMPLVVHPTDPPVGVGTLASMLERGDILCHIYNGQGKTAVEGDGLSPGVSEAHDAGVIYDVAHGRGNFSYEVAETALALGLYPDMISTDMSAANWNQQPLLGLPAVMSKFLGLGLPLEAVVKCATQAPAKALGMEGEWGTLRPGTCADIALLELKPAKGMFCDCSGAKRRADQILTAKATVLDGQIVYRCADVFS